MGKYYMYSIYFPFVIKLHWPLINFYEHFLIFMQIGLYKFMVLRFSSFLKLSYDVKLLHAVVFMRKLFSVKKKKRFKVLDSFRSCV